MSKNTPMNFDDTWTCRSLCSKINKESTRGATAIDTCDDGFCSERRSAICSSYYLTESGHDVIDKRCTKNCDSPARATRQTGVTAPKEKNKYVLKKA